MSHSVQTFRTNSNYLVCFTILSVISPRSIQRILFERTLYFNTPRYDPILSATYVIINVESSNNTKFVFCKIRIYIFIYREIDNFFFRNFRVVSMYISRGSHARENELRFSYKTISESRQEKWE